MKRYPLGLACVVIAAGGVPALASGASPRPGGATGDAGHSLAFDRTASDSFRAFTAPGDLDVSFSGDGKLTTDFGGSDLASAVAVQADGKLVVAGTSDGNFALARYGVDGALDPSFSGDGLVTTDVGGTDDGQGVAIQTDGKIVVAGGSEGSFALARYTTGGGLDPSFSGDGLQTTDFGLEDRATAVVLQADGRIVVGGMSGDDFALARYDAAGALDPSFSGDGQLTTDFGGIDSGHDVAIGADGKIVLMGTHAPGAADFAVARYTANGELDPTFNGIGRVTTDFGRSSSTYDSGEGVAIQPDGRIVVMGYGAESTQFGGYYTRDLQLARYETNGALDRSFSDDGRMETSFYAETLGYGVALESNGRIVTFGQATGALMLGRFNTDGTLDATFSDNGKQTTDAALPRHNESGVDGIVQPDGKLVVVGTNSGGDFTLARFHGDPPDPNPPAPNMPDTQITGGPSGPTNVTAPSYKFTATLSGSTFECKLDGPGTATGTYTSCASPKAYGPLTDGRYTFSVRATRSGNTDPTPATRPFTVDTVAPAVIFDAVPPPYTNNPMAVLEFHSTEPDSTFVCELSTSEIAPFDVGPCVSPRTFGPLYGVAMWYVFISVTDAAGNETGYWFSGNWTVDQHPPTAWILSGPPPVTPATTASFEFIADEDGTFQCKLDGPGTATRAYASCSSPKTYSGLAAGAYTFSMYTIDLAGNGSSAETRSFTVAPNPTPTPSPTATSTPSPSPPGCAATNGTDVPIPDLSTVESLISVSGCPGNASATATVEAHLLHTYIGDLIVTLVAPDGSSYPLHNRAGGSTDNIDQTYTVDLSSEPANGAWKLRVQDAAAADIGRIDSWTISLSAGPTPTPSPTPTSTPTATATATASPSPTPTACAATNGTDVPIPDLSTVESPITLSGCAGNASATATVEAHILHTYIGDLIVSLIAPDGSAYVLHNRAGGSTDNIDQTYTVDLSSEPANGAWKLRVQDAAAADIGRIDSWTINLGAGPTPTPSPTPTATPTSTPSPTGCAATNGTDVPIPDLSTVESPITLSGCAGNASAAATVEAHILHTYIGDLIVTLIAPDGSSYPLHNRAGGSTDNIDQTYTVNLSSEPASGTWRLRVQDAAAADIGRVDSWTLNL